MSDSTDENLLIAGLQVTVSSANDAAIVAAVGEVDMMTVSRLREALFGVLDADTVPPLVAVDLREVGFLSSAGLGLLVDLANTANAREVALRIVAIPSPVLRAIEVTGLDTRFSVYNTLVEALAAPHS
ncbi:STAS domain-containing protein [Pseudonocardia sp. GCM10023141]|uniref:STAS domain-containing protein n=1 Tax=Pseudonocardia sp. GCM10023141 TaxID=3252653 RepID=UPI00361918AA